MKIEEDSLLGQFLAYLVCALIGAGMAYLFMLGLAN